MKALYIINVMKRLSEGLESHLLLLKELGYEVHIAGDFTQYQGDINEIPAVVKQIDLDRSPFKIQNIKAFIQMTSLMKMEKYDFIHCNTPVGGMLGRMCAYFSGTKNVLYQAHGFHFYKGAPKLHNFIYRNIEKFLAIFTDNIITINKEDYEAAQKFKLRKNGKVYYVPGVGVNVEKYKNITVDRDKKREEINVPKDCKLIIMAGDLIPRKNYDTAIRAISKVNNNNLHCIICGTGSEEKKLKQLCEDLNIEDRIHFLGFRKDVVQLMKASDIFLFTTYQEGLARALMEAMACGTVSIVSEIRGNTDLIENGFNGYLINPYDYNSVTNILNKVLHNKEEFIKISENSLNKINNFGIDTVKEEMRYIYNQVQINYTQQI